MVCHADPRQGRDRSRKVLDRCFHLPAGGGAEWAYEDNPLEKVYYILEGEMTVTDKDGKKYVLHKDESISFPPTRAAA